MSRHALMVIFLVVLFLAGGIIVVLLSGGSDAHQLPRQPCYEYEKSPVSPCP